MVLANERIMMQYELTELVSEVEAPARESMLLRMADLNRKWGTTTPEMLTRNNHPQWAWDEYSI
jgi:hypothetical protein